MKINYLRNQCIVCWSNTELYHKSLFFFHTGESLRTVNPLGATMQGCPELAQHWRREKSTLNSLTVNIKSDIVSAHRRQSFLLEWCRAQGSAPNTTWSCLAFGIFINHCTWQTHFKAKIQINGERAATCKDLSPMAMKFAESHIRGWKNVLGDITLHFLPLLLPTLTGSTEQDVALLWPMAI